MVIKCYKSKCDFKKAFVLVWRVLKKTAILHPLDFWLHFQSPPLKPEGVVWCWQQCPEDNEKCNTIFIFFVKIVCTPFTRKLFRNSVENNNQSKLFWNVDLHYFSLQTFIQMCRNTNRFILFHIVSFYELSYNCVENTNLLKGF